MKAFQHTYIFHGLHCTYLPILQVQGTSLNHTYIFHGLHCTYLPILQVQGTSLNQRKGNNVYIGREKR